MPAFLPNALKIALAAMLFMCLLDWPYGYFMFVRVAATACFGLFAYWEWEQKRIPTMFLFVGLALLFQPLVKVALGRELWNILDVLIGLGLLGWAAISLKPKS